MRQKVDHYTTGLYCNLQLYIFIFLLLHADLSEYSAAQIEATYGDHRQDDTEHLEYGHIVAVPHNIGQEDGQRSKGTEHGAVGVEACPTFCRYS